MQTLNLQQDVVLKGQAWTFEDWTRQVREEQKGAREWLTRTEEPWNVPAGLGVKVDGDGRFKPFHGDTVVFPLPDVAPLVAAQEHFKGDYFAEALNPAEFHLTLHDLSNGPDRHSIRWNREACHRIIDRLQDISDTIELVSTGAMSSVNVSVVMAFVPKSDKDFRMLMNLYNLFDEVVYLPYWLRPHVTLAYYRPRPLTAEERLDLFGRMAAVDAMPPIELSIPVRSLVYQVFSDMNHYRTT